MMDLDEHVVGVEDEHVGNVVGSSYKDHVMSPLEHSLCALYAGVNHHEQVVLDMNGGVEAIDMIDLYFSI